MSSTLNITKTLSNDKWVITATVSEGGTLPTQIFVYKNTGVSQLGDYEGIVSVVDLPRIQIWEGQPIPVFGNKYIRHDVGTIYVEGDSDPDLVISGLVKIVKDLSLAYQAAQQSSESYNIP